MNTPDSPFAFTPLSSEDIRRQAPSVFAEHPRPGVSSRYSFVSTAQVIDLLQGEGWEPVRALQQRVRLEARRGYQTHEVRFARRDDLTAVRREREVRPELILQNAHDGSGAYRIDAGLYRLVCMNGLVVADTHFAFVALRHFDLAPDQFICAAQSVIATIPKVLEVVARWQSIELSPAARVEFARRAVALRWEADRPAAKMIDPTKLLIPRRYGDHTGDLWVTMNGVQESLLRGGINYCGGILSGGSLRYVQSRTRPVRAIKESRRLNKALWSLAEEFSHR